MKEYITGPSKKPFVMYGAGGSGKSAMLSKGGHNFPIQRWAQFYLTMVGTTSPYKGGTTKVDDRSAGPRE